MPWRSKDIVRGRDSLLEFAPKGLNGYDHKNKQEDILEGARLVLGPFCDGRLFRFAALLAFKQFQLL